MKKIYALAAVAALAIGGISYAAVGDVVFQSSLSTPSDAPGDGWSRVNGGDETTFGTFGSTGHGSDQQLRIWKNVDGISQNDWLVSPDLDLEAGKTYEVSCWFKFHAGTSKAQHVALHYTAVYPTNDGLESNISKETALEQYNDVNGDCVAQGDADNFLTQWTKLSGTFVAGEGPNYVAFHVQGEYKGGIYVSDFQVVEAESSQIPEQPEQPEQPGEHQCVGLQVPYASLVATSSSSYDEAWTIVNANNDAKQWSPTSTSDFPEGYAMQISYAANMNDFLISPAIHLEAGTEYVVLYNWATYRTKELLSVFLTESADPDVIKTSTPISEHLNIDTNRKPERASIIINPQTTGDYHLTFWGHTEGNEWYIWVNNVQVLENVFAPAAVGSLTATPAENPTLEVALSWTLPVNDAFGQPISDDKTFEKLEIFRDDEERPIATLTEPATSFTDSEEYGLTSGKHTYSIVVTYSGAVSPVAKVGPTAYVGPYEPLPLPADMTVTSDMLGAWKPAYGEAHTNTNVWGPYTTANPDRWRYTAPRGESDDAWIFSPIVIIPEAGYYNVAISGTNGSNYDNSFVETYIADAQAIDANLTPVNLDWKLFTSANRTQTITFYAAEAGNYCIATRVNVPAGQSTAFIHDISSIKVERGQMVPNTVTALKATAAADESLKITVSWTNPTESTAGTELAAGSYYTEVYRQNGSDFELLATLTQGESEYIDEAIPAAGAYTYGVQTLATGTEAHLDNQPTVTSSWAGPREVALPYTVQFTSTSDATRFIWEGIDGDEDGSTWGFGYSNRMVCPQPATDLADQDMAGYYQYNDFLLSPIFDLKPGYYTLSFQMYGRSSQHGSYNYDMFMNVGLAKAGEFIPGRTELIGKEQVSNSMTYADTKTLSFKVEEAGKYQIVFAADEINYKVYGSSYELGLGKVDFKYNPVLPTVATDLTVTPDADGALSATLSWTNPTTSSIQGVAPELTEAIITRDGQEVASITDGLAPGEVSEWIDDEVPSAGIHVYTVTLFTAEGPHTAAAPSVMSPWIGNGLEAPYAVEPGQYVEHGWDQHAPNKTTSTWGEANCWDLTTSNGARYDQSGYTDVDGYLITPKLEINHTQGYKLSVTAWKTSMTETEKAEGYPVEILIGSEGTPDTWTTVGTVAIMNSTSSAVPAELYIRGDKDFAPAVEALADETEGEGDGEETPEEPVVKPGETLEAAIAVPAGTQRLAFHINKNYSSGLFMFHKFAIDKEGETTGIENVSIADGITIGVNGLRFEGTATDVRIFDLSGKLIRFAAEAEGEISLEGLAKGAYIVRFALDGRPVALKIAR